MAIWQRAAETASSKDEEVDDGVGLGKDLGLPMPEEICKALD